MYKSRYVIVERRFVSCVVPVAYRLVRLAVPPFRVWILARSVLVVLALVVEALEVWKLAEVPKRVAMVALVAIRLVKYPVTKDAMFPRILVTVVEARVVDPAVRLVMFELVEVELVIVPLATSSAGRLRLLTERLVRVAFVRVALVPVRLVVLVVDKSSTKTITTY